VDEILHRQASVKHPSIGTCRAALPALGPLARGSGLHRILFSTTTGSGPQKVSFVRAVQTMIIGENDVHNEGPHPSGWADARQMTLLSGAFSKD
jgi:hypothetical protein